MFLFKRSEVSTLVSTVPIYSILIDFSNIFYERQNMQVPLNDLKRLYAKHATELESSALEVMRSGWWISGAQNKKFCEQFAKSLSIKHCIGVGNGTDALELAIRALQARDPRFSHQGEKSEIITVANAGGYATTACYLAGCIPVYVDIEPKSQLLCMKSALCALSEKTLAVLVTHLYGGLVDVLALRKMMDDAGYSHVSILEDCAQAHGLSYVKGAAGTLGDIAAFSFYPTKNLGALGDGGAVVTNDDTLALYVRTLQQYGWENKYTIGAPFGKNSRLDELQAALLSVLLGSLNENNAHRCRVFKIYQTALPKGVEIVKSPHANVAHLAVVMTQERNRLRQHLTSHKIATDIHYPILDCCQKGWQGMEHKIASSGLEVSKTSVNKILTIPCFATLKPEEMDVVCKALSSYVA